MAQPIQNDPLVAELVERLRGEFDPCTIYLFGSRATGEARTDSDFDVMVVIPDTEESQFDRYRRGQTVLGGFPEAVDLLVYTQSEWDFLAPKMYSIARRVRDQGVLLHAA